MLHLRQLGQYPPPGYPPPGGGLLSPYPTPPYHPIDPTVYYALQAAGQALAASGDPGAPQTVDLIRRNIQAQGFPWEWFSAGGQSAPGKVSNVNSTLSLVTTARENPIISTLLLIGIPVFAYMLGKKSK